MPPPESFPAGGEDARDRATPDPTAPHVSAALRPSSLPGAPGCDCVMEVEGTVQGVGFRPFIARAATARGLAGWVRNSPRGVTIRAAGADGAVTGLLAEIRRGGPPAAHVTAVHLRPADPTRDAPPGLDDAAFAILDSEVATGASVPVTPDLALCADCRRELLDPGDRRYRYPFLNCTNCGPRYTIVRALPYDRDRTTMAGFTLCPDCAREFADPADRRYHAQPNACPRCGPQVGLTGRDGRPLAAGWDALQAAALALRTGGIVAVKGIGGFHLMVDATHASAVAELRRRKAREEKPLAVMFASLADLRAEAEPTAAEADALASPAAPIVLVRRRGASRLASGIAPGSPWVGALLASAPLHVLLLEAAGRPLVATSGNLAEEPLCIDNAEAFARLGAIADRFLVHDRPIARPIDDSVLRCANDGPVLLRRARGFAPTPLPLPESARVGPGLLCLGGHFKNAIAVTVGSDLVLSPHLGDLSHPRGREAFRHAIALLGSLHGTAADVVVCDAHPDYASTREAEKLGRVVVRVQHHLAHVLACLLEHGGGPGRVLGVAWDGTGFGPDGTIWGGEFIVVDHERRSAQRVAHLRPFRLAGGETAVREPRRSALGVLHAAWAGERSRIAPWLPRLGFRGADAAALLSLLDRDRLAPVTTSAGRLFDAVAALLGLRTHCSFEGQAAMELEFAADRAVASRRRDATRGPADGETDPLAGLEPWPMPLDGNTLDWAPAVAALLREGAAGATAELAARFHATLAEAIVAVARRTGCEHVVLTGGCFQNVLLLEAATARLHRAGFSVLRHRALPPNDGGLAAGQALGARWGLTDVLA